jgi:hypothetical protein
MIKIISIVIMMLAFNSIFAQRIGYFGGLNRNHFYDFKNDDKLAYYEANYTTGTVFEFGVSIENVKIDSIPMRFTVSISNYKGTVSVEDGYLLGGSTSNFTSNKYVVNAGVFPVNVELEKNISFNLGGQFSYLLAQSIVGEHVKYRANEGQERIKMDSDFFDTRRNLYFGISARLSYDIELQNDWILAPQYNFYLGLTTEFKNIESKTNSMRHLIGIGFTKIL